MTISLRSLRVTAEMDASSYARGAAQKTAADGLMVDSAQRMAASFAAADAQTQRTIPGLTKLSRSYIEGYSEAAKFEAQIRTLSAAMDHGLDPTRAAMIYGGMSDKLGMTASAAELARSGFVGLVPVVDQVNARMMATGAAMDHTAAGMHRTAAGAMLNRGEMANLSYQFNDMAVMLASGQSPFMMLMQQGMQVGQIIGPYGLQGGMRALGTGLMSFVLNPVNLAVVGFASLAGAVSMFVNSAKSSLPSVEDLLKQQKDLLGELKDLYGDAGKGFGERSPEPEFVIRFRAEMNLEQSTAKMKEDFRTLLENPAFGLNKPYLDLYPEMKLPAVNPFIAFQALFEEAQRDLDAGTLKAAELREEIIKLPSASPAVNAVKQEFIAMSEEVAENQRAVEAFKGALESLPSPRDAGARMLMGTLRDARTAADRLRAETALDIRDMSATTPGDKAAIAVERERLRMLEDQVHPIEAAARIEAARTIALAQATGEIEKQTLQIREQVAEQDKQRLRSANDNIASARLDLTMIGKTPAEQQEARANLQTFLDLQRQAEDNGLAFDTAQYGRLKAINAELALMNQQMAVRTLEKDIGSERSALFMPTAEGDILKRLQGAGIQEGTADFARFAEQLREIQEIESSFGYGFRRGFEEMSAEVNNFAGTTQQIMGNLNSGMEDVWVNFAKTGELEFTSLIDTMMTDLARLSYQLAMSGLLNSLGLGQSQTPAGGGFMSMLMGMFGGGVAPSQSANGNVFYGGMQRFANGGAFANSIVSRPTMFAYGAGNLGIMGEAGPEAVMPLRRGSDGRLGVAAAGGGGGGGAVVNVYNQVGDAKVEQSQRKNADGSMTIDVWFKKKLEQHSPDVNRKAIPGGFGLPPSLINR